MEEDLTTYVIERKLVHGVLVDVKVYEKQESPVVQVMSLSSTFKVRNTAG